MVAYDDEHIGDAKLSPEEIARAIRHKKYGVDMREAIAQAFEYMNAWWGQVKIINDEIQDLFQKNKDLESEISKLKSEDAKLQQQIDEESGKRVEEVTRIEAEIGKNASDINNLRIDFDNYDKRLKKLEDAVFGLNPIEVNEDLKPDPGTRPTQVINTDSRKKRKEEYGW